MRENNMNLNKKVWTNQSNNHMYEDMPIKFFEDVAAQGGLDDCCDLKSIDHYIKPARSVLEVGAGYGRVLSYITKTYNKNHLSGIERNEKLYKFLVTKFPHVKIILADINNFKAESKFDLILWMWGGLSEFSQYEQLHTFSKLISNLDKNGYLIFDTILPDCKTIQANNLNDGNYVIQTEYGNDFIYLPSEQEISDYVKKLNVHLVEKIIYATKTKKKRHLYVLTAKN